MFSRRPEPARGPRVGSAARAVAAGLAAAALAAPPLAAATGPERCDVAYPGADAFETLVLEVRVADAPVHEAILAYERGGALWLPLAELVAAFELAIDVDVFGGRASGWVGDESRRFELDLAQCRLEVDGEARALAGLTLLRPGDDLYLPASALEDWLPVAFTWDARRMRLDVESREPLPVELRFARERRRRFGFAGPDPGAGGFYREEPYRLWSLPFLDANVAGRTSRDADGRRRDWRVESDLNAAGDLLWMSSRVFFSGRSDGVQRLRMNAGRRDVSGRIGPLGLTGFTLGDIASPSLPGIARIHTGRGLTLTSFPIDYTNELGELSLEGDLPVGWEVELYRGDLLLDFQRVGDDQRYVFEQVPTQPGLNVFRLVFYGPRGEQREEERRVWTSGALVPAGSARFRLTANQHERDLVELGDAGFDDGDRGQPRGIAELEVGVLDSLSFAVAAASLPIQAEQRHFGALALRGSWLGAFGQLDLLGAHDGGYGLGGSVQTRALGHTWTAMHHAFDDFLSERTELDGGRLLRSQSHVAVDGATQRFWRPVTYRISAEHDRLRGGIEDTHLELRASTWAYPVVLSNAVRAELLSGPRSSRVVHGEVAARARLGDFLLRGRLLYGIDPADATFASVALDWRQTLDSLARVEVGYDFHGHTLTSFTIGQRLGQVFLTTSVDVDERGHLSAYAGLSFGLAPNPTTRRYEMQRPGASNHGGVAARVFLDRNANGTYDEPDLPLPDVQIDVRGAPDTRSGPDGTVFVGGLGVDRRLPVSIDPGSLEDPLWVVPNERTDVVLRPGVSTRLDFAVVPTGEIDGHVYLERDGLRRSAAGVELVVNDHYGQVVRRLRSEVDGFYLVDRLPPGRYRLRVVASDARRRLAEPPPPVAFEIEPSGNVVSGRDLVLHAR